MIQVDIGPRVIRTARRLGPKVTAEAEERLREVARHFGDPHRHSGLGLRKLGRFSYEARIWLDWRIVLILDAGRLVAYDIMNHDQVRAWLRGPGGH